jgi:predicted GTPase
MVVLRPGDRVLVTFVDEPPQETTNEIAASLRKTFPGVDFTVLTGVASIAVSPGR